jgi:type I restriction enzyme S subunit
VLAIKRISEIMIPLPPLDEQQRIVAQIEGVAGSLQKAQELRENQRDDLQRLLLSAFHSIADAAPKASMKDIAPLVRRPVTLSFDTSYPELGIRSFFKGTFHKPPLTALELGSKRVFWIEPGDLLFSNVFAWEGAIAIAGPQDAHRIGSHRYITCVPQADIAEARFLLQYFRTEEGFGRIQDASPGGAGRNRTLGLGALANIKVPLPSVEKQRWFAELHARAEQLVAELERTKVLYDALVPAILERTFQSSLAADSHSSEPISACA